MLNLNSPRNSTGLISRPIALSSLTLLATGSMLALAGCDSAYSSPRYHEHRTLQVAHVAGAALGVNNSNGSIEAIRTERSDVEIEVELYGRDLERLELATVHAVREADNELSIWVEWPGTKRKNGEGASIVIEIPDANNFHAKTHNGKITSIGLSGFADLDTSNGAITVKQHDGSVYARTSNGRLTAEHVSGEIEMYSSNGKVQIIDAFGPIQAETSNGRVFISTMDGNEGPLRVRTSNGRIELDLGDGFQGVLKCQTSNGGIELSGLDNAKFIRSSKNQIELQLGDSPEVSAVRTSNGSLTVRSRHVEP
jgi:Toastrack DUF4097